MTDTAAFYFMLLFSAELCLVICLWLAIGIKKLHERGICLRSLGSAKKESLLPQSASQPGELQEVTGHADTLKQDSPPVLGATHPQVPDMAETEEVDEKAIRRRKEDSGHPPPDEASHDEYAAPPLKLGRPFETSSAPRASAGDAGTHEAANTEGQATEERKGQNEDEMVAEHAGRRGGDQPGILSPADRSGPEATFEAHGTSQPTDEQKEPASAGAPPGAGRGVKLNLSGLLGKALVSKLTAEEAKDLKEEVLTPAVAPGPGPSGAAKDIVIRRLVGAGATELAKRFAKTSKEQGKAEWTNTHFILVFDCSGTLLLTSRLYARTTVEVADNRVRILLGAAQGDEECGRVRHDLRR